MEHLTNESRGLGDTIAKLTHITGIDLVAKKIALLMGKDDCGCGERQEILNRMVPYSLSKKDNGTVINKNGTNIRIYNKPN